VLEAVKEPLIHLVRNAVDHGIEPPEARAAAGKPRRGRLAATISSLEGGRVEIVLEDDGRGLDTARVREAAQRAGIAEPAGDEAALALVQQSGMSTSFVVTDVSGRGLGLAIVKEQVEKLGGDMVMTSRPGHGMRIRLVVPASISTFRGLPVRAGGQTFLLPVGAVEHVVHRDALDPAVTVAALADLLGVAANGTPPQACAILRSGEARAGVLVDEVLGDREVLVKDFAPPLVHLRHVAGAGLMDTSELVLILRPADLVAGAREVRPKRPEPAAEPTREATILVVDDALTTRAMERSLLEVAGYRVEVAVDGLEAWRMLRGGGFDLVVSDVDMPRMDGFELTSRIRADPRLADLPVVLVTALEGHEDQRRGLEAGANAYVVKSSFERSSLLETIKRLGVHP
jgi:two-component system chemotaxis sensor kinase CheA